MLIHFLNREIYRSVGASPSAGRLGYYLCLLLACTDDVMFTPMSSILENDQLDSIVLGLALYAVGVGELVLVSEHPSVGEHVQHAKMLYQFDQARYASYFSGKHLSLDTPLHLKLDDTTEYIDRQVRHSIDSSTDLSTFVKSSSDRARIHASADALQRTLNERHGRAITASLFANVPELKDDLRSAARMISSMYIKHYQEATASDIPTGIRELQYFDELSVEFPRFDVGFFAALIEAANVNPAELLHETEYKKIIAQRKSSEHRARVQMIDWARAVIERLSNINHRFEANSVLKSEPKFYKTTRRILGEIRNRPQTSLPSKDPLQRVYDVAAHVVLHYGMRMGDNNLLWRAPMRVLLLTATPKETLAVRGAVEERLNIVLTDVYDENYAYLRGAKSGSPNIFLAQSEMGAGGVGGAMLTARELIDQIRPDYVIMVGICFGLREDKGQKLGDIIVGAQVKSYDPRKISASGEISRGDKIPASPKLMNRIAIARSNWKGVAIHSGLLLSGSVLVNSEEFRAKLKREEPEAEGGEMEAAGVFAAAMREKVDCVLIKGIADWGVNKQEGSQELAAGNAIDFIMHMFQAGAFDR